MALCDGYFRRRFPDISWSIRLDGLSPQAGAQSHGRCRSRGTPGAHRCSSDRRSGPTDCRATAALPTDI